MKKFLAIVLVLVLIPQLCFAKIFWVSDLHLGSTKKRTNESSTIYPKKSYNWFVNFLKDNISSSDYVLVTGDITHKGQKKYYKKLKKLQKKWNIIYVRGNHDKKFIFPVNQVIDTPEYRIITLDSGMSNGWGTLNSSQIDFLKSNLSKNTIVALHHPCFSREGDFLNFCQPLLNLPIDKVLTGHYHQNFENELNGIKFLTISAFSSKRHFRKIN